MTNDKKQKYNTEYYAKNRKAILSKVLKKVDCDNCGRSVNHQNLSKHQKTALCKKNARIKADIDRAEIPVDNYNNLKAEIAELKAIVIDMSKK
jgi:hypothetical protein